MKLNVSWVNYYIERKKSNRYFHIFLNQYKLKRRDQHASQRVKRNNWVYKKKMYVMKFPIEMSTFCLKADVASVIVKSQMWHGSSGQSSIPCVSCVCSRAKLSLGNIPECVHREGFSPTLHPTVLSPASTGQHYYRACQLYRFVR